MNPPGMFRNGEREQEYSTKCLLPTSGRLIPEFDRRRNIKDMFTRKPSQKPNIVSTALERTASVQEKESPTVSDGNNTPSVQTTEENKLTQGITRKRSEKSEPPAPPVTLKRSKSSSVAQASTPSAPGQKTLKGFFKPKSTPNEEPPTETQSPAKASNETMTPHGSPSKHSLPPSSSQPESDTSFTNNTTPTKPQSSSASASASATGSASQDGEFVIDQVASKEDWTRLFSKKPPPNCEGHQEPCVSLTTKKPGVNCGRAFWICQRPVGPTGNKEKGTQWRCPTFIWASDWNSS